MNCLRYLLIFAAFPILEFSCKKNGEIVVPVSISALTVVNAVVNSNPLIATFSTDSAVATYYETTPEIGYGSFNEYSLVSGATPLLIFQMTDTLNPLYQSTLNLKPSAIYSFFLTGVYNIQNKADTLLTVDSIPYYNQADSVTGVRFVNLAPGGNPINIDLQSAPTIFLAANLGYKNITGFQSLSANANAQTEGYTFEFRDAVSDSLLATYPLNILVSKSQTLAFFGTPAAGLQVMQINNY